jgi:hypothetical protein
LPLAHLWREYYCAFAAAHSQPAGAIHPGAASKTAGTEYLSSTLFRHLFDFLNIIVTDFRQKKTAP